MAPSAGLLHENPDDWARIQLNLEPAKAPWKKVSLAIGLLVAGVIMLITGLVLYFTYPTAHGIPLIVLGCVTFIPGSYYTRIAYLSWKGYRGYSLANIPDV